MEEGTMAREQNEKKVRKLKSKVWDAFTRTEPSVEEGKRWAILATCNYCGAEFDGCSKKGTTHLKNHLASKTCRDKRNGGNGEKSTKTRDKSATPVVMEEKSNVIDLIKHIFDEEEVYDTEDWDASVLNSRKDDWDASVLNSRKDEILQVYQKEKEKFGEFLSKLSCRFSLSIYGGDFGNHDDSVLMVHYIDDSWERQSKIIGFLPKYGKCIEETKELRLELTKELCLDLKIDRNICCIILNDESLMENDQREVIESWCSQRGSLPFAGFPLDFEGFLLEIDTFADIMDIYGIQKCVDYIYKKTSSSTKVMLQRAVYNVGKNVNLNNPDSIAGLAPFGILEVGVGLKEAFSELQKIDPDFISINLTDRQWDAATATFQHLNALKEFLESLSWDDCSITTKAAGVLELFGFHISEDCHFCKDESYKKLFDSIQVYSLIAILDPRFKMDTIRHFYKRIYGSDGDVYLEKIIKYFRDIYNEYAKDSSDDYEVLDVMGGPSTSSTKTEFDLYLHDLKVPAAQEFDILAWWCRNDLFFPTLARMARDYLAIPFQLNDINSTLVSEAKCFSYVEIDDDIKSALINLRGLLLD